jgi:allantoin racemase
MSSECLPVDPLRYVNGMTSSRFRIGVLGAGAATRPGEDVPDLLTAAAGLEADLVRIDPPGVPFPGTPAARSEVADLYASAARAAAGGVDAVYVNTFGDYGLAAIRAAGPRPAAGAGEAALAAGGERFAVVTIWPASLAFIYAERLAATGAGERCRGVFHVQRDDGGLCLPPLEAMERLGERDPVLHAAILDTAREALAETGADTIVLGCTCMSAIAAELADTLGRPVVETMTTGLAALLRTLRAGRSAEAV